MTINLKIGPSTPMQMMINEFSMQIQNTAFF